VKRKIRNTASWINLANVTVLKLKRKRVKRPTKEGPAQSVEFDQQP
jgi:hypothetical protein